VGLLVNVSEKISLYLVLMSSEMFGLFVKIVPGIF
jgi:hypothetical protein